MNNIKRVDKKRQITYCIIFLLALCFRFARLIIAPLLTRDSVYYLNQADLWFETNDYSSLVHLGFNPQPPFPVWTIKKMMELGFGSEVAGRAISIFLGAFIPVIGFALADIIIKKRGGGEVTALFLILHPNLVSYSIQPLRENYYLFFSGVFFLCLTDAIKRNSAWDWFFCGVMAAFSLFCRYEAIELAFMCPIVILFSNVWHRITKKNAIKNVLCCIIGFVITSALLFPITHYDFSFIRKVNMYVNSVE